MDIAAFLHVKLNIHEVDRSLRFYRGLLNLREVCRYPLPNGLIVQLSPSGESPAIELWYEEPHLPIENQQIHIAFDVPNVVGFAAKLRAQGVAIERGPFRIGHEIIAFIRDPDGYLIELNQDTNKNPASAADLALLREQ